MSNHIEPQIFRYRQEAKVPDGPVRNTTSDAFCELCAGPCEFPDAQIGDALDRILSEPEIDLDEALAIASGRDMLTPPTRSHLQAMYEQLVRTELYAKELERVVMEVPQI